MAKIKVKPLKTCELIMSHPHLVTPQQFEADKPGDPPPDPQYNCVGIISPEQQETKAFKRMQRMLREVETAFFNGRKPKYRYPPFKKCEDSWEEDERTGKVIQKPGYMAGGLSISLKGGTEQPDIRDQKMRVITDAAVLYPGCKFIAVVTAYGYNFRGNKGISWGLKALQKIGEGENIAGRVKAEDYFDEIDSDDDEDDPDERDERDEEDEDEDDEPRRGKKPKKRPKFMDSDEDDVEI